MLVFSPEAVPSFCWNLYLAILEEPWLSLILGRGSQFNLQLNMKIQRICKAKPIELLSSRQYSLSSPLLPLYRSVKPLLSASKGQRAEQQSALARYISSLHSLKGTLCDQHLIYSFCNWWKVGFLRCRLRAFLQLLHAFDIVGLITRRCPQGVSYCLFLEEEGSARLQVVSVIIIQLGSQFQDRGLIPQLTQLFLESLKYKFCIYARSSFCDCDAQVHNVRLIGAPKFQSLGAWRSMSSRGGTSPCSQLSFPMHHKWGPRVWCLPLPIFMNHKTIALQAALANQDTNNAISTFLHISCKLHLQNSCLYQGKEDVLFKNSNFHDQVFYSFC